MPTGGHIVEGVELLRRNSLEPSLAFGSVGGSFEIIEN